MHLVFCLMIAASEILLPQEGLFFGSGVYGNTNNGADVKFEYTGHAHNRWIGTRPTPHQAIELTESEGLGNLVQFWQNGDYLADLAETAVKRGLYAMTIYAANDPKVARRCAALGGAWVGYDTGEAFSWSDKDCGDKPNPNLKDVADGFMRRVREHVAQRHAAGWGTVLSTGADFSMDYQVLAGIDVPCTEDMPFRNLMLSSALERGVMRQYGLPFWGSHIAHEWNAFIPFANPLRMPLLFASFQLKYMTGAKLIINESGNFEVQTALCEDSPMHLLPQVETGRPGRHTATKEELAPYLAEARAKDGLINYDSEVCRAYRAEMKRFWDFVKANPAPKGQPQASFAIAKGNFDLCGEHTEPAMPIGGAERIADGNVNWFPGAPELSWELVKRLFFPRPDDVLKPSKNMFLGGTPYGLCDITSFAYDSNRADFLLKNYKAVLFAGWNTCSEKQYKILCDYVKGGGTLLIALPHLSCDLNRNYQTFKREDLVNGGDFSELMGVKVVGRTGVIWWATAPDKKRKTPNALGLTWPQRCGIMGCRAGELQLTGPAEDYEMLAVDDEAAKPIVLCAKKGKGRVYFLNTWCYPAAADTDEGPGAYYGSKGLASRLYAAVAKEARGDVYITARGSDEPDAACEYVISTYFPEAGRICLKNVDFRKSHTVDLHRFGKVETITLKPTEFVSLSAHVGADSAEKPALSMQDDNRPIANPFPELSFCIRAPLHENVGRFCDFIRYRLSKDGYKKLFLRVNYNYAYESHPACRAENVLTKEDAKRILSACRESGVKLIPKANLFGHQPGTTLTNGVAKVGILKAYPDMDESRGEKTVRSESRRSICPRHPKAMSVALDLARELIAVFEADSFHFGCDEVFEIGLCERCRGIDKARLFAYWVNAFARELKKEGVRPYIWADRLIDRAKTGCMDDWEASDSGTQNALAHLDKDIVLCDWHYWERENFSSVTQIAEAGFKMWISTWCHACAARPYIDYAKKHAASNVLGVMMTTWMSAESFLDGLEGKIDMKANDERQLIQRGEANVYRKLSVP